jgi:hypothetical protein
MVTVALLATFCAHVCAASQMLQLAVQATLCFSECLWFSLAHPTARLLAVRRARVPRRTIDAFIAYSCVAKHSFIIDALSATL